MQGSNNWIESNEKKAHRTLADELRVAGEGQLCALLHFYQSTQLLQQDLIRRAVCAETGKENKWFWPKLEGSKG